MIFLFEENALRIPFNLVFLNVTQNVTWLFLGDLLLNLSCNANIVPVFLSKNKKVFYVIVQINSISPARRRTFNCRDVQ